MGYAAKAVSDHTHKELHPDEIFELFKETFENVKKPLDIQKVHFQQNGHITTQVTSSFEGRVITTEADGNGRLDAVSNALKKAYDMQYITGFLHRACTGNEHKFKGNCIRGYPETGWIPFLGCRRRQRHYPCIYRCLSHRYQQSIEKTLYL